MHEMGGENKMQMWRTHSQCCRIAKFSTGIVMPKYGMVNKFGLTPLRFKAVLEKSAALRFSKTPEKQFIAMAHRQKPHSG